MKKILNLILMALTFGKKQGWFKEAPRPTLPPLVALVGQFSNQRARTVKRLGFALWGFLGLVLYLLWIEAQAIAQGGDSTISRVVWGAWASQPGAILLILVALSWVIAYLFGHFFWQTADTYEDIRKGRR